MPKLLMSVSLLLVALALVGTTGRVYAAQNNMANNNPQVVAYYGTGDHGVVGEQNGLGWDLVKQNGNSGSFQQWFYGTQPGETDGLHGDHSLWLVAQGTTCPPNFTLVYTPNPGWGDYLQSGVNYCVQTNDFHPSN